MFININVFLYSILLQLYTLVFLQDGHIDFREFMIVLYVMSNGSPEENLKQIFRVFDINNDGSISLKVYNSLVINLILILNISTLRQKFLFHMGGKTTLTTRTINNFLYTIYCTNAKGIFHLLIMMMRTKTSMVMMKAMVMMPSMLLMRVMVLM